MLACLVEKKNHKSSYNNPDFAIDDQHAADTSGGHAISISACEDDQHATNTSAFSESGKQMENTNTRVANASLLASMHKDILAAKRKSFSLWGLFHCERLQEPLLSSSKEFDVNEPFVL
ncbi:hypothetical protein L1987_27138 [Smallanthus sonchifolius]|uniref:Uncharacterized protein n=1 Tax=Smallanthus sonchifolius TaxID=185202 RepID=A0ACB9IC87_9ASTR|nr:hypothetical protein L1987_27138 [Smallanthus sonchifolius]